MANKSKRRKSKKPKRTTTERAGPAVGIESMLRQAVSIHQAGQLDQAAKIYVQVIDLDPLNADAHHLVGVISYQQGKHLQAIEQISHAISIDPLVSEFHLNIGAAYQSSGQVSEAIGSYRQSLHLNPDSEVTHNNLGNALKAMGHLRDSLEHFEKSIQINPEYAEAHNNLGAVLTDLGHLEDAEVSLQKALLLNPTMVEALSNLAMLRTRQGNADSAIVTYCDALQSNPGSAGTWSNLANLLYDQGKTSDAESAYRQVGALRKRTVWNFRADTLCPVISHSNEQINQFRDGLHSTIQQFSGVRLTDDVNDLTKANCHPSFYLAYQGRNDRTLKSDYAELFRNVITQVRRDPNQGAAHIGFVVPDRREAVFLRFMEGIVNRLSSKELNVSIICSAEAQSLLSPSIHDNSVEYTIVPNHLGQTATAVKDSSVDVLFFLEIGTDPFSYFLPFYQSAPIQCTSWGVPVTSGIPSMQYFVSSELLETDESDQHYSEALVRLRSLPVSYRRPRQEVALIQDRPCGLSRVEHLYLCPQSLFKIHPDFDQLLANILRTDADGRIVLIEGRFKEWSQLLISRFERSIPDVANRITFVPSQSPEGFEHLIRSADVILDPIHFGGGATTYEALSHGVPVVTLPGSFMRGRVTSACYQKMDMMDCVALNDQEYVNLAVKLGTDPAYRNDISSTIRSSCGVLYDDNAAVEELRDFFLDTIHAQR